MAQLVGRLLGEVAGIPPQPLPHIDSRTHALNAFKEFIASLKFNRAGAKGGKAIPFGIPAAQIHIEQPDNVEDLKFPAISFLPSRGKYIEFGLGPGNLIDATLNKFAPGTALLEMAEYEEVITVEIWGSKRGERRAIMAGLESIMLSSDDSWALRFKLTEYFDVVATFSLDERMNIDDSDAVRNRRRGHLYVTMGVCLVQLVNVATLTPYVAVEVDC